MAPAAAATTTKRAPVGHNKKSTMLECPVLFLASMSAKTTTATTAITKTTRIMAPSLSSLLLVLKTNNQSQESSSLQHSEVATATIVSKEET